MTAPRPAYPETKVPFTWPTPGVRTWAAPAQSYFDECSASAAAGDEHMCRVGVQNVNGYVYGCDCVCHQADRVRLSRR